MDVLETKPSNDSFCSSFLKDGSEVDIKDEFVCELIRKQNDYEIKSKSEISSLNARVITHIYEKIDRKHNYIYDYKFREHLTSLGYDEQSCDQIISYLSDSYDGSLNLEETKAFFNLFSSPCWNFKLDMHLTRLLNCPLMPGFIDSFTDHQQVCHANYDHLWQKLHNFLLSHRLPAEAINEPYLENRIAVVNLRQRILYEVEKSYEELNSKNKTVCMDQECISLIKVCCSRERMNSLIDGSAHTYWQTSSDKCESHWIYISLKENVKLTSLSLHSIASKGDDTTLKSVLIEVRVGSNAAKTETVIAKCDYSLTNNTDYVICSCFPSDQDISYLKIVFKRPSEKNSFWGKLSDQIKVKWIHLVGKWVQPATTSKTSVQDAAICWYFEMMSSMSLIQSQLVPSLYPKILEITKSALKNIPPLSLANNSQNGVLSPSVLKKVDEFLKSFLEISQSNPENKPNAILTYLSFSLARGNLKTILDAINLILENSELSYEYSELIAQIDEASQLSLRKTAQSMNSKLIKLDENNSSATTTTNKPAATATTTTGTINSTSNNEIDIVADSSNDETCEFSLEPYHQKMQESNKTAGCSSSSSLSSSSTSSPSNCCYNMLLAVESNMTVTNINLKLKLDSIGVKSAIVVIIFNKNKPELEKFEEFDDFDQEKFDSYKEKTKKTNDSTERKEFEICYFDFFDNQIDIFLELPIYHLAKYILVKLIRPIEGNQTKPLTITKIRVLGCKHDGFELYDELKQLQNQSNTNKNSSYLLNSVLWFLCQLAQQHLEIANLWQVYEKSIEIGKKPDQERFASLKIPALILLYELVNCAEMKTSEMGKNEAVVAQRQNAKILENLCELIDGKSESSSNADDKKSQPPEETSLDRVLKTITKQIIKNGISVFFSSSNECRHYFLSMVDTNTGKSSPKSSSPSSTTTTFKYETSLKKPSGKLLLEALCNLFCSSKSNMVQYLIGSSGNLFETSQSHRNLLDLVEKMIELSSNILDANNVYSGVELLLLDNRLVLSLIDLLNSIQSNIFFKLKTCLSKLYSQAESQVYENATRFVLDYAGLLIEKSRYLIEKNTSSSPSNSFLIDCFFTKLVYNFILWLSETLYLFKLSMASKFTKIFISFYELAKLLQKRAKIEESEKCLKTWTFDSKNKCSIFDLVINYSFPLATRFVIEFDPSSVLVFSESSTDAATYLFIDSYQKNHGFMGKLGSSNWKTTMEIKSNSSLVFSIRSNKDLKSSSLFNLKFTVRAYGYENASLQRVNVYEGELCEAVEATLGAHLSRLYAHRMRPHDFEFDENIKLLLTSDVTTPATTKDRLLADHFDSDFYRVVVRGGRKETQSVDTNSPLTESPVDDDERLWRFLKKVARFLEDGYEPEPMVAKFVEMYDPQIKSFNKLGGRSFNDLLIRLVSSMLWLNPSIHFSDLFTIYDESLQTQTTTKPKLNSHVLAAFKFVESTRITVVRQQQQNNINQNLNNSTTTNISLIESMRKRADYLLGVDRLSESLLTYETLIRQRVEQQQPSSNHNYQHKINDLSDQQQTERKSPLIHHRMPLPKCASHPIYTLIFEFAFDCQLDLPLIDECLFLKRTNAALLCENFDLVRAHIEASFTNSIPENDRDEGLIQQHLEMVLILLSNFFSTWSRGRFNVVEANSHSANKSSPTVSTSKSFDSAILFPPTLKFKPNSYLQSLYGCGLDVEQRLRASYYGFLKGLISYSSKIRSQPNIDRLNSCLNCYILILLSIDWDINDLSYLSSSNLNVIDYLVDNCAHYMPITSEWSKVVVDAIRHKTPSDLLEDSFSLSRDRYNDAVNKGSGSGGSGGSAEKQQLAMLEEIDEEEEDEEAEATDETEPPERKKEKREPSGGDREYVERPLFDSESFDLNLFPRMYHLVFGSGSGSGSSKFDTESLIKCLTFEIKSYEQYEKYIVARYMFWKYFSKLKTNFYCDSCSIILTSNRYVCLECRDHCFCTSCFVKSMISSATELPSSSNSSDQTTTALTTKKKKPPQISFVNPSGIHRPSHRMLLLDHVCDQCNSLIIGKRIACRTCPDYDLCLSCHREIVSHSIKPSKAHKSDHSVDIHEPIIVVAKPGDVTNTQVFLYLQSQMLYSTLALKSTLLHTTVRRVDDSQLVGLNMNQERSLIAGVYKQGFKCLLDMISASKSASLSSTNVNDRLGVFAFYNQETIIGLLACLVKLMHDDGGAEMSELSSLSLVRFVLTMLKDNESFDNDVCIMLVNILGSLLVKCEPVECDRIAKEIFFNDEESTKAEEEKPLEEGEKKKKKSSESSILEFIVDSIESFMQIDQITTVIAYLNLLFKLDASAGSKWRLQISNFLSSLLDQLLNYDASSLTPSSTASLLRTHSFLHALTFAADSSIFNGVWIEFKSESLYDGAGILRSNPDFKLGLTRIFYCDSCSQNPLTYFISLIEPETRKIVNLKAQKFESHFRRVGGTESRLKLRSHFTLDPQHIVQIEKLIKRLVFSGGVVNSSVNYIVEGKRTGSSHSLRVTAKNSENSIPEMTAATGGDSQLTQPNLKQYEVVHVNKKRKFAAQFGQMRLSSNWLLNCLVNMLKNGFSDIILENEQDISKLEAACSDTDFLSIVYKLSFLSTQLNPYWKLRHLRKFLGNLYFFEENAIVSEFVEYELETGSGGSTSGPTETETLSDQHHDTETTTTTATTTTTKRWTKLHAHSTKGSSISISFKAGPNAAPATYYTCEDLKLTADKQTAILGICEASNSYMFKSHELSSFSDDQYNSRGGDQDYSRARQSLALLENCTEKLTKFETASFNIPKSSTNVNPLARPTNSKSLNETIKSVMRLISNAVIVLSSREMLVQLIKISNSVSTLSSRQQQIIQLPPGPINQAVQREYELLQLLDVLFHTDTLSTYKSIVVKTLLSAASSSENEENNNDVKLVLSRMACVHMLPEFKLVKRENWSSTSAASSSAADEKRGANDRGRIRRHRPLAALTSGLAENAVQFANSSTTAVNNQMSTFSYSQAASAFKQSADSATDFVASTGDAANGSKPGDIERLTSADSSNLLVVFDLNKTSVNANKNGFNLIAAFKRPNRQLASRLLRQSKASLWLAKNNAAHRIIQQQEQSSNTTSKQELVQYTDDFESSKTTNSESKSIQEALISSTSDSTTTSGLKPIPARSKKLLSKRAELGDENEAEDEVPEDDDKYDIDQEDDDMIMATTRTKKITPRYRFFSSCLRHIRPSPKAFETRAVRKCFINFQLVSKRKDPNDPRNMGEYGGDLTGDNEHDGMDDDDEDDNEVDSSESDSENSSSSDDDDDEDDEDDDQDPTISDVTPVDHEDDDEDDDDADTIDKHHAKNDKSSMDSYDETDEKETCFLGRGRGAFRSTNQNYDAENNRYFTPLRGRNELDYKWNAAEYEDDDEYEENEKEEDRNDDEDEENDDEEMNTDNDAEELEWFEVDGESSAAAHATTNYHHGGRGGGHNDSDSDDNKHMRTNFRVSIDQLSDLPYLGFHNQRTFKWKFSRRSDNDWATSATPADTCSFKIYSSVSRNFESSYHILDELIDHMDLANNKQLPSQQGQHANNLWLHLIHAACVQTFTCRLKLLGLLVKMIKRVYYHHCDNDEGSSSSSDLDLTLPIDLFALRPLKSLHYTLETYYKLDRNLSRALYELFYFAEKLAIKFRVEKEFVARLRDKQELVKKFVETACIVGLISASINLSASTSPETASNKHNNESKPTKKTIPIRSKIESSDEDDDEDKLTTKWCKKSSNLSKPSTSSWSPPSLDLKVETDKKDGGDDQDDDDEDEEEEFFDGNENQHDNDGECEEIEDDEDDSDDDEINSKLGDL